MNTIAVTGGSGFLGRHLVESLAVAPQVQVRVLSRSTRSVNSPATPNIVWLRGDLENPDALRALMTGSRALVNLAYPGGWTIDRHRAAAERLGAIAAESNVKRVIHCSTAVVVGRSRGQVTEDTRVNPETEYERAKETIERGIAAALAGRCELAILRPTAVFGPGGMNLFKLATALTGGRRSLNYLKSSLLGRRRMNLVCVANVVEAIRFLVDYPGVLRGAIYLVSDDDDPMNTFAGVERVLMSALEVPPYRVSPVPVPEAVRALTLRLAGRPSDGSQWFDPSRLRAAGYSPTISLERGLLQFAHWFQSQRR